MTYLTFTTSAMTTSTKTATTTTITHRDRKTYLVIIGWLLLDKNVLKEVKCLLQLPDSRVAGDAAGSYEPSVNI